MQFITPPNATVSINGPFLRKRYPAIIRADLLPSVASEIRQGTFRPLGLDIPGVNLPWSLRIVLVAREMRRERERGGRGGEEKNETGSERLNIKRAQPLGCSSAKLAQGTSCELENEAEETEKAGRRK